VILQPLQAAGHVGADVLEALQGPDVALRRHGRVLIDASATAREAGIRWPVALTRAVRERCVTVPPSVLCQDESGRL
jgi:hypothetical protein